ncbi:hypothetical protein JW979_03680 [bacterium]|nr:hypothetical protein [candidate division CSSED10-310 bacterium]
MKRMLILTGFMFLFSAVCAADELIPQPPDLSEIYQLVNQPAGDCNAADSYQKAEEMLRNDENLVKDGYLDENSEPYKLVLQGIECGRCVFPYSLDMKLPPYEQMIPMMKLYRSAAKTFARKGQEALEKKDYATAEKWFAKAVILGLQFWEEPGITIIQDLITMSILTEGVEGFGDLFIAKGDGPKAVACARYLAEKTAYNDALRDFVKNKLRNGDAWPPQATETFKEIARLYPTLKYLPIKVEILLRTAEINAFDETQEAKEICRKVIEEGKRDADARIRKMAEWAESLPKDSAVELIKSLGGEVPKEPPTSQK